MDSKIQTLIAVVILIVFTAVLASIIAVSYKNQTNEQSGNVDTTVALDEYIRKLDDSYKYVLLPELTTRFEDDGITSFVLNMTSQTWLSPREVNWNTWWHFMIISIPDDPRYDDKGLLYITGGSNRDDPPNPRTDPEHRLLLRLIKGTGMVGAMLRQCPNGPMKFWADPKEKSRGGDDIIAYTFRYYFEGPRENPEWLLLMPMVKAAKRALDTMQGFVPKIKQFYVGGISNRGWTTWLLSAVDSRVKAAIPICLDFLNMEENLMHHWQSMGGWSFAFRPYWEENNTVYLTDDDSHVVTGIVDPLAYRDRLDLPKFIVSAGSDEFFLPDDSHYYYGALIGPKYLRVHQNTNHPLPGHWRRLADETAGFVLSVEEEWDLPVLEWTRTELEDIAYITLKSDPEPYNITAWRAETYTAERRDFRVLVAREKNTTNVEFQPTVYRQVDVSNPEPNTFIATIDKPRAGWACYFMEMMYEGPHGSYMTFTTEVHIVPDIFPYPKCQGRECGGSLV